MVNSIGVDRSKQKLSIAVISKAIVNKIIILKWRWFEALVKNGVFVGNENRPILMVVKILSWDLIIYMSQALILQRSLEAGIQRAVRSFLQK